MEYEEVVFFNTVIEKQREMNAKLDEIMVLLNPEEPKKVQPTQQPKAMQPQGPQKMRRTQPQDEIEEEME